MKLHIADNLSLPLESVTRTFAIMGIRGSGKTHTAVVMVEEMLKAGQPVCIYDPVGAWFGLKTSADGKRPGFPVVIFGGEHQDVPLEESAGEMIARVIVERRIAAILDCSLLRKGARVRFMADFCETLYHINREPLHFVADEAHTIAPLNPRRGDKDVPVARALGAMEDIILLGRRRGLGGTVISQRPALVNTSVRTQCETLIAMRIVGPHDLGAIKEWTDAHGTPEQAEELLPALPMLKTGVGFVWSVWLDIFEQVAFRQRETFDSSATPKVGQKVITPKVVAEIDLAALGEKIRATVEQAKANDPSQLKRRILELERQLTQRPKERVEKTIEKLVEVPVLKNGQLTRTEKLADRVESFIGKFTGELSELRRLIAPAAAPRREALPANVAALPGAIHIQVEGKPSVRQPAAAKPPRQRAELDDDESVEEESGELRKTAVRILDTVLMLKARGIEADRDSVARWLGLHPNGGRYGRDLARLRKLGFLDDFALTELGKEVATAQETGFNAVIAALDTMKKGATKRKILKTIASAGKSLSREELAELLGLHPNGGRYGRDLAWLRQMRVIPERAAIYLTEGALR